MSKDDFPFAVSLTSTVGWDLWKGDFEFMMVLEPKGCFVLLHNSKKIGIVTTIRYDHVGWLGNLIVRKEYRKKGAGTMLATHAIKYLTDAGAETIGLYSYTDSIPFYERLGFKQDSRFAYLRGKGFSFRGTPHLRQAEESDIKRILEYDCSCLGFSRAKLLNPILMCPDNICYVAIENAELVGYVIAKVSDGTAEIGPLLCDSRRFEVAIGLLSTLINRVSNFDIFMCVAEKQGAFLDWVKKHGFRVGFHVVRMFRGEPVDEDCVCISESLERG